MRVLRLLFSLSILFLAPSVYADTILATDLSQFAILGGGGVALNGATSTIVGSVGAYPTTAITGVIPTNYTISGGTVQPGNQAAAQGQLLMAINALSASGPTIPEGTSLGTITLDPGVYTFSSSLLMTGTLTLDGLGNANALWIFNVTSSLTAMGDVNVINTGAGAGVYWNVGASATLDGPTFQGNVLANQSITVGPNVTDSCGRLLTQVASVTLAGNDTIGIGCSGALAGSNGLSGGGTITGTGGGVTPLPPSTTNVPEPASFLLLGSGAGILALRRKFIS